MMRLGIYPWIEAKQEKKITDIEHLMPTRVEAGNSVGVVASAGNVARLERRDSSGWPVFGRG